MNLGMSQRVTPLVARVRAMVRNEIIPLEDEYEREIGRLGDRFAFTSRQTEILENLKAKAQGQKLWNFWLTNSSRGGGLAIVDHAYLAEEMGWSRIAPEVFDCSAPDTGNMEVLERYGTKAQKDTWLTPLREG